MPVAEDLVAPVRERRLTLLVHGWRSSAKAHEHRLLRSASRRSPS